MDQVIARVKRLRKKPYLKLLSDSVLFDALDLDLDNCIPYNPDHNLDEDDWFKIESFSTKPFCLDLLKKDFDSKDYDDLKKDQFQKIAYLISIQGDDFYFQKVTPSLFVKRKSLVFGEAAELKQDQARLVINNLPDAVYYKNSDVLVFKNLATISSIYEGIDILYKEATDGEVKKFLDESFIELDESYGLDNVSKLNRRRIGLALVTLNSLSASDKADMLGYINDYCGETQLDYDEDSFKFTIGSDQQLKFLLYGIEQRFYTTPFGKEKRVANSIVSLD